MTGKRVLTALVLIPVAVGIVWFAPTWVVAIVLYGVLLVALREFFEIGKAAGLVGYPLWIMVCSGLLILAQCIDPAGARRYIGIGSILYPIAFSLESVLLLAVFGVSVLILRDGRGIAKLLPAGAVSVAGLLFIAFPFSFLVRLHGLEKGAKLVLLALVVVWVGDSVAYFVGRGLGKHKLAPEISPKKTVEGAIGNVAGSVAVALAFQWWLPVSVLHLAIVGVGISVAGQLGDLAESAWKRSAGVKDSGSLLPGHGGMLDRIDALIFAAPVVWWYFQLVAWR